MNADRQEQHGGADSADGVESMQVVSPSRRRLFKGAAGSAGVLLAVHAKTALGGGVCQSPSAMMSGNTSPRPGSGTICSGGRSPGFWKVPQHSSYWAKPGAVFPTFKVKVYECASGLKGLKITDVKTQGTLLTTVFGSTNIPLNYRNYGIWAVLAFPTEFGSGGQLMRHCSAAWLNAGYFNTATEQYPVTQAQVIAMFNAVAGGGTYCPLSSCGTNGWTAAQVISYFEGMYDINSGVEPNLCKS